ncbi:SDR family NAD(P)-dependent oxidoreductase [Granulosicoccus antarcticus]|uniref:Putative oxidoreductase YciK n=1 Tax=Granulosicoccus antarcticus IMCC3135 TaxID=1192854 RepID=A0A2Z2NZF5_9GAMM|nr:SDR family NAD(P)-dependent oxidoreductase [Granulosicoccus antarcticus]ASJ76659.1 putative oxidoreductase YciK [Granulosicoccus antarcticus IMCC3135]
MEKSVVPSFTSIGPGIRRRLHHWPPLESYSLVGKVVVLTGATSGIGEAAASLYAHAGATLVIVARNPDKANVLLETLRKESGNSDLHAFIADLGVREEVERVAAELASQFPVIDVLAHNAGILLNQRKRADNGTDLSVELMVVTPFLLTALLLPQLGYHSPDPAQESGHQPHSAQQREPGRVLTMSSGGMYTEGLSVEHLEMTDDNYQGMQQYARAKRAQVVLNEIWAEKVPANEVVFHALHPGWVDTPGVSDALPGFSKVLKPLGLLRSPREGADTLMWLSAAAEPANRSGQFWHDRAVRDINMSNATRKSDTQEKRDALWDWCEKHTRWQWPANK